MGNTQLLRGFTTISYWAADLEAAKRWYTELLGIEPYFHRPGYCEFRVGDYQHGRFWKEFGDNGELAVASGA